jgi:hypothetical protein
VLVARHDIPARRHRWRGQTPPAVVPAPQPQGASLAAATDSIDGARSGQRRRRHHTSAAPRTTPPIPVVRSPTGRRSAAGPPPRAAPAATAIRARWRSGPRHGVRRPGGPPSNIDAIPAPAPAAVPTPPPPTTSRWRCKLQRVGDYDKALAQYRQLLEQNDSSAEVHNNLGLLYQDRGQNDDAVQELAGDRARQST